ncbi:Ser-Thr-rich glycosyl-phosphatidyl-inositol-anchored membrane family-domain-containing protein [Triangularia verruculosa]|uniref:Ser-Thr-rich glycosyl-phosphatidyl-inositol-anchored membrane family-domain-containing protein n=1 Tax=Triangularia verruculosa TaxID=2587418 RepID=A0AAN6XRF7_9PEZI|nr:Ser-Thr-rich glycosyl-phosphatidyl-inositol-anchored membrane family-domain-containing protein [Triangularia verruculosa]
MRFSVLAVLGFASAALAQDATPGFNVLSKPAFDEEIPAGKAYNIEWAGTEEFPETITIDLYGGPARNALNKISTIASGVDSAEGTYSWAVPASLGSAKVYGLHIQSETNATRFQWGNPFTVKSGKGGDTSTTASSESASATETKTTVTSTKASETKSSVETKTTLTTILPSNATTTSAPVETTVTSIIDEEEEETTTTTTPAATSTSTTVPTGAGVRAVGGVSSFALLGGVALAVLAY